MLFNEYQELAWKTVNEEVDIIDNCLIGLYGESGELVDLLKKIAFHKHPVDDAMREKLKKEIGDNLWYSACLAKSYCEMALRLCWQNDVSEHHFLGFNDIDSYYEINMDMSADPPYDLAELAHKMAFGAMNLAPRVIAVKMVSGDKGLVADAIHSYIDCLGAIAHCFGLKLDDCAIHNIEKLRARYGEKFSTAASINRRDS